MVFRVLVATDGSAHGTAAFERALSLVVRREDTALTILYVAQKLPFIFGGPVYAAAPEHYETVEAVNRTFLMEGKRFVQSLATKCRQCGVFVETRVTQADHTGDEICRYAESTDVSLIVVGCRGLGVVKRLLLGSTSYFVLHHAPCPVLVVKLKEEGSTPQRPPPTTSTKMD